MSLYIRKIVTHSDHNIQGLPCCRPNNSARNFSHTWIMSRSLCCAVSAVYIVTNMQGHIQNYRLNEERQQLVMMPSKLKWFVLIIDATGTHMYGYRFTCWQLTSQPQTWLWGYVLRCGYVCVSGCVCVCIVWHFSSGKRKQIQVANGIHIRLNMYRLRYWLLWSSPVSLRMFCSNKWPISIEQYDMNVWDFNQNTLAWVIFVICVCFCASECREEATTTKKPTKQQQKSLHSRNICLVCNEWTCSTELFIIGL